MLAIVLTMVLFLMLTLVLNLDLTHVLTGVMTLVLTLVLALTLTFSWVRAISRLSSKPPSVLPCHGYLSLAQSAIRWTECVRELREFLPLRF